MLVLASQDELPESRRVWGTGGWVEPEGREALDWLTFARLHGWNAQVTFHPLQQLPQARSNWVVVAHDPSILGRAEIELLENTDALVVMRSTRSGNSFSGRRLEWLGPGPARRWSCRTPVPSRILDAAAGDEVWATLDGAPVVIASRRRQSIVVELGFHPSRARDADGSVTALLRHLLVWGTPEPVAWLDLEGCLVLRMDDPGSAENAHSRDWSYPELGPGEWIEIGDILHTRDARLSVGYVSGWVDDGDQGRGTLEIAGRSTIREAGAVHPSPLVRYRTSAGTLHDYRGEYEALRALRQRGLVEIELHGHTHMHPDTDAWAEAADRYEAVAWYRELGSAAATAIDALPRHPLRTGMHELRRWFGASPTTLICPGDEWTTEALEEALDLGLQLVSSYYLALRDANRFLWAQHVCGPYLDKPDPAWFDSGLPVVGTFHDYEPSVHGVDWIAEQLDRWREAGARRFIDLRELVGAIERKLRVEGGRLIVDADGAPPLSRPLGIFVRKSDTVERVEVPSAT